MNSWDTSRSGASQNKRVPLVSQELTNDFKAIPLAIPHELREGVPGILQNVASSKTKVNKRYF